MSHPRNQELVARVGYGVTSGAGKCGYGQPRPGRAQAAGEIDLVDRLYLTLPVPNLVVGGQVVSASWLADPRHRRPAGRRPARLHRHHHAPPALGPRAARPLPPSGIGVVMHHQITSHFRRQTQYRAPSRGNFGLEIPQSPPFVASVGLCVWYGTGCPACQLFRANASVSWLVSSRLSSRSASAIQGPAWQSLSASCHLSDRSGQVTPPRRLCPRG